jgi:hypothetical protein
MRLILRTLLLASVFLIPLVHAGEVTSDLPASKTPVATSWKLSLAPLLASQALDVTSSYGKHELNPVLAGPRGQFGISSVSVKIGVTAGVIGMEYLIVRVHPASARIFTKANWAAAAVTTGVAVHNFTIR